MERLAVAVFPDRAKAEPTFRRLVDAGVRPQIHKHELLLEKLWFTPRKHPVRIEVPSNELERAEELLFDWDDRGELADAVHCPECNSLRVQYPQFAHKSVIPNAIVGLMAAFGKELQYYCEDCHYTWSDADFRPPIVRKHSAPYYFIE